MGGDPADVLADTTRAGGGERGGNRLGNGLRSRFRDPRDRRRLGLPVPHHHRPARREGQTRPALGRGRGGDGHAAPRGASCSASRHPFPPTGLFGFGRKAPKPPDSGLEVVIELPDPNCGTGEVSARGAFFGNPPPEFTRSGEKIIVRLLDGIQRTLNNVEERRKHPRIPATFPLVIYPFHSDGRVEAPIRSICHDVSVGGLAMFCPTKPLAKYAYVAFEEVPGIAGLAVLLQIIRCELVHDEVFVTGRYRLDLGPDGQ